MAAFLKKKFYQCKSERNLTLRVHPETLEKALFIEPSIDFFSCLAAVNTPKCLVYAVIPWPGASKVTTLCFSTQCSRLVCSAQGVPV